MVDDGGAIDSVLAPATNADACKAAHRSDAAASSFDLLPPPPLPAIRERALVLIVLRPCLRIELNQQHYNIYI
jgi:hypothetical protein